ncbi:uncharacterized protein LOC123533412 [Mercenaria mercenaria]|uniref:uncharacterized protein LOC123533412 n=1 Tax=Mercenaria mercenaria TaxID=6596 RepID=UPI00234F56BA|nr:uncharacterized protein LOC123533412 [Mercenaria mercenaria]
MGQKIFNSVLSSQPSVSLQQPYQFLTTVDVTSTTVKPKTPGNPSGCMSVYTTTLTGPSVLTANTRPLPEVSKTVDTDISSSFQTQFGPYTTASSHGIPHMGGNCMPFDIIGDNFDISVNPNEMTKDSQRQSLHWFLYCKLQKRVHADHLPDNGQTANISEVPNSVYVPTSTDSNTMKSDFVYYMAKTACQYIDFLKPSESVLEDYLQHAHMKEMSEKSQCSLCELIDRSENDSEGIITILDRIQRKVVPHTHTHTQNPEVIQNVVFGGDVLTNERAYSAQLAMSNGNTNYDRLGGFIHRPEGFHRIINFVQMIYQTFYKQSADRGTLWQLRNVVNRRDVSGPKEVVQKLRPHQTFIEDTLDAHIVAATLRHFGMATCEDKPTRNCPHPLLPHSGQQKQWIDKQFSAIFEEEIADSMNVFDELASEMDNHDREFFLVEEMKGEELYKCSECGKTYKREKGMKKHLTNVHKWEFMKEAKKDTNSKAKTSPVASEIDSCFLFFALLMRSTVEAFKHDDGERAARNIKYEYILAGIGGHTKYRLWLWRMLAYMNCLLSPRLSYECKWNISANMIGGHAGNIPNDNLVEISVETVKKKLKTQGANVTFKSAQTACQTIQPLAVIKSVLEKQCKAVIKSGKHVKKNKQNDIVDMVQQLMLVNKVQNVQGFEGVILPLNKVHSHDINKWLLDQKKRAKTEMTV